MTRAQIEELIVKASKATKGPWTSERVDFESEITFEIGPKHYGDSGFRFILRESNYEIERYPGDFSSNIAKLKGDAEFISSANPNVVTNLCEIVLGLTDGLQGLLSNVALDWYVDQYRKDESPSGIATGVVAKIYNRDIEERTKRAFEKGREALEKFGVK